MSRPETHDDLPSYKTSANTVATFQTREMDTQLDLPLTKAMYDFAARAEELGMVVKTDYGTLTVERPLTQDELDKELRSAQRSYDDKRDQYGRWLRGEPTEHEREQMGKYDWKRRELNSFAEEEGLELIDWTVYGFEEKDES